MLELIRDVTVYGAANSRFGCALSDSRPLPQVDALKLNETTLEKVHSYKRVQNSAIFARGKDEPAYIVLPTGVFGLHRDALPGLEKFTADGMKRFLRAYGFTAMEGSSQTFARDGVSFVGIPQRELIVLNSAGKFDGLFISSKVSSEFQGGKVTEELFPPDRKIKNIVIQNSSGKFVFDSLNQHKFVDLHRIPNKLRALQPIEDSSRTKEGDLPFMTGRLVEAHRLPKDTNLGRELNRNRLAIQALGVTREAVAQALQLLVDTLELEGVGGQTRIHFNGDAYYVYKAGDERQSFTKSPLKGMDAPFPTYKILRASDGTSIKVNRELISHIRYFNFYRSIEIGSASDGAPIERTLSLEPNSVGRFLGFGKELSKPGLSSDSVVKLSANLNAPAIISTADEVTRFVSLANSGAGVASGMNYRVVPRDLRTALQVMPYVGPSSDYSTVRIDRNRFDLRQLEPGIVKTSDDLRVLQYFDDPRFEREIAPRISRIDLSNETPDMQKWAMVSLLDDVLGAEAARARRAELLLDKWRKSGSSSGLDNQFMLSNVLERLSRTKIDHSRLDALAKTVPELRTILRRELSENGLQTTGDSFSSLLNKKTELDGRNEFRKWVERMRRETFSPQSVSDLVSLYAKVGKNTGFQFSPQDRALLAAFKIDPSDVALANALHGTVGHRAYEPLIQSINGVVGEQRVTNQAVATLKTVLPDNIFSLVRPMVDALLVGGFWPDRRSGKDKLKAFTESVVTTPPQSKVELTNRFGAFYLPEMAGLIRAGYVTIDVLGGERTYPEVRLYLKRDKVFGTSATPRSGDKERFKEISAAGKKYSISDSQIKVNSQLFGLLPNTGEIVQYQPEYRPIEPFDGLPYP